jgi:hypothetical protein
MPARCAIGLNDHRRAKAAKNSGHAAMKMTSLKRYRWRLVILLMVAGCTGLVCYETQKGWTPRRIEKAIQANVSAGSTRMQIEAWLDSIAPEAAEAGCRVYHDYLTYQFVRGPYSDLIGDQSPLKLSGLRADDITSMVRGTFDGANVDLILAGRVTAYFFLDKNERLVGTYVHTFIDGP